jgi:hypothetical protein
MSERLFAALVSAVASPVCETTSSVEAGAHAVRRRAAAAVTPTARARVERDGERHG